jgi:acyl carrier protein
MRDIKGVILNVVRDFGREWENKELEECDIKTVLFGKNLDSMGVVLLVTELEEEIFNRFDMQILLADERAMSQKTSPFRSVNSLVGYVESLVHEKES